MIHHRQGAGHTEADWTRVRTWLRSKLNRRSAKHFRARLELDVYFQADRSYVVHRKFQIEDFKFEEADLRVATKIATNSLASSSSGCTRFAESKLASMINSSQN
jgi:hypothetical protein